MDSFIRHDEADRDKKVHTETVSLPGIGEVHREAPSMATKVDTISPDYVYVGKARIGAAATQPLWQIKKVLLGTEISVLYADGNNNFDNIWDDRASLTYT